MAQINSIVGAIEANARKVVDFAKQAKKAGCDLVVFPELALTGYPPEDLLLKPAFVDDNLKALEKLASKLGPITCIVGYVDRASTLRNSAAIIHNGRIAGRYHKMFLPNYGVFDEQRYFAPGVTPLNFVLRGVTIGVGICEDIWYPDGPARAQAKAGAELIVNINASPYHMGKVHTREQLLFERSRDNRVMIAYNNLVGAQDELVFDGQGMVVDAKGELIARAKPFEEDLLVVDLDFEGHPRKRAGAKGVDTIELEDLPRKRAHGRVRTRIERTLPQNEEVLSSLILGTRDYVYKNGFKHATIGISGGIDSALVAAVAAKALGNRFITGVFMPSRYTSKESRDDAFALASNLGIELITVPIDDVFTTYLDTLKGALKGAKPDITEENIQARIRGNILMALSNKFGWLVLTTGNKSEMSVGYSTLYGDMAGGFAVIKDVPKTLVYEVSRQVNLEAGFELIPERVFTKAPSAELRPGQKDQDSLPPYEELDPILKAYVEDDLSAKEIASLGFKKSVVEKVLRLVDRSEYKRRQAPPGVKITPRALGKDRRMPITNCYEPFKR